jgi:hypothetical protein
LKQQSEETRHQKYLDTIEGLETRLKAIENWKKCQQEKEDGHRSLDPRDGKGFVVEEERIVQVGGLIGRALFPAPPKIGPCCFGFEADRECDESNRCKY